MYVLRRTQTSGLTRLQPTTTTRRSRRSSTLVAWRCLTWWIRRASPSGRHIWAMWWARAALTGRRQRRLLSRAPAHPPRRRAPGGGSDASAGNCAGGAPRRGRTRCRRGRLSHRGRRPAGQWTSADDGSGRARPGSRGRGAAPRAQRALGPPADRHGELTLTYATGGCSTWWCSTR